MNDTAKRRPISQAALLVLQAGLTLVLWASGWSGTAQAVTCAYDNVPAATLLVPYFRVSRNGATTGPIPTGGIDTLCAVVNTRSTGLVAKVVVWNKYGKPVLGLNVPMNAYDVAAFSMRDVLNGYLNVNPNTQRSGSTDPCKRTTGFGSTRYTRFTNPDAADAVQAIGYYTNPAYPGTTRALLWDSLDESGEVGSYTSPASPNVLDGDNAACGASDGLLSGDFTGYVTVDVVNFCTDFLPTQAEYYANDALATAGWSASGQSPNALIGDYFLLDPAMSTGNLTAQPMVALEFDTRLDWTIGKTFYGKRRSLEPTAGSTAPAAFCFRGDGREPLGTSYGIRLLSDAALAFQTSIYVWRDADADLCAWQGCGGCPGSGYYDASHELIASVYDTDGNLSVVGGSGSGPYLFLNTQRLSFPTAVLNPLGAFTGWVNLTIPGSAQNAQAVVGLQINARPGVRDGYHVTATDNQFLCSPSIFTTPGNTP